MEIPKFGSFKPKPKPEAKPSSPPRKGDASQRSHRVEKRHRSSDRDRRRRRDGDEDTPERRRHDPRDRRKQSQDIDHVHHKSSNPPIKISQDEFVESNLFIVDRRGDSKNVEYGSLHRYSIPAYRRTGYGNVVGLPTSSKIDREASSEKQICLVRSASGKRAHPKAAKLLSSKYGKSSETKLRFVSATVPDAGDSPENDFIEFHTSRKRKRGMQSSSVSDHGHDNAKDIDYRSIEGKAKSTNKPVDDDVELASDSDDDNAHYDLDLRARQENAVLSKKAKASPSVLEPWLELCRHQCELIRPSTEVTSFTHSERRTLAELRLAILNEAGKHISPDKPGRERLLLSTIEEGVLIWDKTKLAARWQEVLKERPASILLWSKYMDFIQDSQSSFRYEDCKEAYLQWLRILRQAYDSSSGENRVQVTRTQMYALLRFTFFVRDAGYDELATAIWQALFEWHFFMPAAVAEHSHETRLDAMTEFWESEVPRIGEEGAQTWWKSHDTGYAGARRKPVPATRFDIDPQTPLSSFARKEAELGRRFLLPVSTEDEDAVTDPFRCVLFSDIRNVLDSLSIDLPKVELISAFLHFFGLPSYTRVSDTQRWQKEPHLTSSFSPVKLTCRREGTYSLFTTAFAAFHTSQPAQGDELARFLDRVLDSLVPTQPSDELAEYHLAFRLRLFPSEAPNAAKRILKTRPSSLRLYNAFALIEAHLDHLPKALGVWSTALGMLDREEAVRLWHSRLITQVRNRDEEAALEALFLIANTTGNNDSLQVQNLKLRRDLESGFDQKLLASKVDESVLYADMLAWLTYLTSAYSLPATLEVYATYLAKLTRQPQALEELHQNQADLVALHITRQRPHKPSVLQHNLTQALQQFPNNSVLRELRARITLSDPLRALVREQQQPRQSEPSVVEWSHIIAEAIDKTAGGGATVNPVRALFYRALLTPGSKVACSRHLWRAWLMFEKGEGGRVVFLDGLRFLPGCKWWVVNGMERGVLGGEKEMRRVWEVLGERGLRTRVDVEDFV